MSDAPTPRIDITTTWAHLNDELIRLVDYVPDEKINWSPKPELWNFRGILIHIAGARDGWLTGTVKDGDTTSAYTTARSKAEIQEAYRRTWSRLKTGLLDNEQRLNASYEDDDPEHPIITGHWIAFHLLEHDIHHRADIFHYLTLLGIETPDVGTP